MSRDLLNRLARLERNKKRAAPGRAAEGSSKVDEPVKVSKVDVSSPSSFPKLPEEWRDWGEEARYVFLERMGVGVELNMDEEEAFFVARSEAILTEKKVPASLFTLTRTALVLFGGDLDKVRTREPGERIERSRP